MLIGKLFFASLMITVVAHCNNYGLLEKLENPGSANGVKETFTSNNYVFISSWLVQGNIATSPFSECTGMTGVASADCSCTRAAATNGLRKSSSHQFFAILSTSSPIYEIRCKIQGLVQGTCSPIVDSAPWFDTQGRTVAANLNNLMSAVNPLGVEYTENGSVPGTDLAWTGSTTTAINSTFSCNGWAINTNATTGTVGTRLGINGQWLDSSSNLNCDTYQRVYCASKP